MSKLHLLVSTAFPSFAEHADPETGIAPHPNLGRLLTPRHTSRAADTAEAGHIWGADNDCFQGLDEKAYVDMLGKIAGLPGCRFVAVPDVVRCVGCHLTGDNYDGAGFCRCKDRIVYGDAELTAKRFAEWAPVVKGYGLPIALVAQDGLERVGVPWDEIDALFIGGSTDWKMGRIAHSYASEARRRGAWVHWGRVNTKTRIEHIAKTRSVDSVDGSSWAKFRKATDRKGERLLDKGLRWCREAERAHLERIPERADLAGVVA